LGKEKIFNHAFYFGKMLLLKDWYFDYVKMGEYNMFGIITLGCYIVGK
jgi:hypothetical protein